MGHQHTIIKLMTVIVAEEFHGIAICFFQKKLLDMKIFTYTKIRILFAFPFVVAFFSCLASLNAQDYKTYYYELYQANRLYNQGNYSEALLRYEAASQMVNFVETPHLKKFLKAAKKTKNQSLQKKYESLIERQKKTPAEYAHLGPQLDRLIAEDQRVRTKKQKLIKYYWKNIDNKSVMNSSKFLKAKKAEEDWCRTDSLNIQILLSMFEEHGFLNESKIGYERYYNCLLYTSPSPRDATLSRMPSSA